MVQLRPEVPLPSAAAVDRALSLLSQRLGESKVLSRAESCEVYASDDSEAIGRVPSAVVLATSPKDIQETLAIAAETGVPVTPRSGGTGRVG
ncbi:MAG: hypothetical protein RJA70_3207, partial [Pseudomonadota bacterium]